MEKKTKVTALWTFSGVHDIWCSYGNKAVKHSSTVDLSTCTLYKSNISQSLSTHFASAQ